MRGDFDLAEFVEQLRQSGVRSDVRQYLAANQTLLAFAARGVDLTTDPRALASHLAPIFSGSPEEQVLVRERLLAWHADPLPPPPPPPPERDGPTRARAGRRIIEWLKPRALPIAVATLACALAMGIVGIWYFGGHRVAVNVSADLIDGKAPDLRKVRATFGAVPESVDESGRFFVTTRRAQSTRTLQVSLAGYDTQELPINFLTPTPIEFHLAPPLNPLPPPSEKRTAEILGEPVLLGEKKLANTATPPTYVPWTTLLGAAVGVAALMLFGLEFVHRKRRDVVLKRMGTLGENPTLLTLRPPVPRISDIPPLALRRISAGLRRARTQDMTSFNIKGTVEATARAGGLFSAVRVARTATPEYLVLVDRRSADDQSALMIGHWIDQLEQFGVAVNRYAFSGDPRVCWKEDAPQRRLQLAELLPRHHQASLLLFAESVVCVDPLSGKTWPWVKSLRVLPRCALLTFAPPYRWSGTDWLMVQAGFVVLPASVAGLHLAVTLGEEWHQPHVPANYARAYPALMSGNDARWLDRNAPPPETVTLLLRQVHGYLGPSGYTWLSTCAIYPQMSWPITLALLDVLLDAGDEAGRRRALEEQLPSLSRLPWFRYGYMPDWLRRVCIASLPKTVESAARAQLGEMVFHLLNSTTSLVQGSGIPAGPGADLRLWSTPLDLAASAPAGSPLNDAVFLGFLGGADPDPLALHLRGLPSAVRAPARTLWRYAYGRWRLVAMRWPRTIRGLIAALTGVVAFTAPMFWLLRVPQLAPPKPFAVTYTLVPDVSRTDSAGASSGVFEVSANGKLLAYARGAGSIYVTDAAAPADGFYLDTKLTARRLTFSPDGTLLAALYYDGPVRIWNVAARTGRDLSEAQPYSAPYTVEFSQDGRRLVLAGTTGIAILNVGDLTPASKASFTGPEPYGVTLSQSGGNFAAVTYADGSVAVWDTRSGKLIRQAKTNWVLRGQVAISADGRWLAGSVADDKTSNPTIALWNVSDPRATARTIKVADGNCELAFSPDGKLLAIREPAMTSLYDVEAAQSGTPLTTVPIPAPSGVSVGPLIAVRFSLTASDPHRTEFDVLQWPAQDIPRILAGQDYRITSAGGNSQPGTLPPAQDQGQSPSAPPNNGDRYWIYLGRRLAGSWTQKYINFSDKFDPAGFNATSNPSARQYKVLQSSPLNVRYGSFGSAGGLPPVNTVLGPGQTVTLKSIAQWFNSGDWWATIDLPKRSGGNAAQTASAPTARAPLPAKTLAAQNAINAAAPNAAPQPSEAQQVSEPKATPRLAAPSGVSVNADRAQTVPTPAAPSGLSVSVDGARDPSPLTAANPAADKPGDTYYVLALTSSSCKTADAEIDRVKVKSGQDPKRLFPGIRTYQPRDAKCTLLLNDTPLPVQPATELKNRAIEAGFGSDTWLMKSNDAYFEEKNNAQKGQSAQ